jgi:hypothetical protein
VSVATAPADCAAQIRRLDSLVDSWSGEVRVVRRDDPARCAAELGLARRGQGRPSVVVGDQVASELGRPGAVSRAIVLCTSQQDLVEDGRVRCAGPDLDQAPPERGLDFAQAVIVAVHPEHWPDPFELETTQYLANRLQGFMARTVPGRLWVRFARDLVDRGFALQDLGLALCAAFRLDFAEIVRAEVVLATGRPARSRALGSIAAEAKVLGGRHRKLVLAEQGVYECADLDCDDCDERETCDALKEVTVRYRRRHAP